MQELLARARQAGYRRCRERGFTVTELVVLMAIVGLLSVMTVPFFVSYYQAAAARADVQNGNVCVTLPDNAHMLLRRGGCSGPAWIGAGTDDAGNLTLPPGFTITPPSTVTFNYLGAADVVQTYTMTNSTTGGTMTISIAMTGRVTSP